MEKSAAVKDILIIVFSFSLLSFAQEISPFGMGIYPGRFSPNKLSKVLKLANAAGIKWTRMDFYWPEIEPWQGNFSWDQLDWQVDSVRAHSIKILGILGFTPEWVSHYAPTTIEQRELFGHYVYETVKHFKGRVDYWEIWNEPNGGSFWKPRPNVEDYTKLLKIAYIEAKKGNPNCTVLAPGLSNMDTDFIEGIYEHGGGKYFDVFSFHPYPSYSWGPPDVNLVWGAKAIRKIMCRYGKVKPFWISEFGYSTRVSGVPEEMQAVNLVRGYVQGIALHFEDIMWYDFIDDGVDIQDNEMSWGVLNHDYIPKPSYAAYKKMTEMLASSRFEKSIFGNEGQVRGMLFKRSNKRIIVLWSVKGISGIELKVGVKQVTLTNLYGNVSRIACPDGVLKLHLSESPVYVSDFTVTPVRLDRTISAFVPRQWLVCGPFLSSKDNGLQADFLKSQGGESAVEPKPGEIVKNDSLPEGKTNWKQFETDEVGVGNLISIFKPNENVVAYAFCNIKSDANRTAVLDVSSDDGNKVWINHQDVLLDHNHRKVWEGERLVEVRLYKGSNPCLMKIENRAGGWGFYLRVLGN
uniref:Glycoside hydrolase family 5 domain-containing protein n=1 Tax=candidate division WOR-3 bacterium TaxID=2052148 RepID=A0A7V3KPT5_UNCW3